MTPRSSLGCWSIAVLTCTSAYANLRGHETTATTTTTREVQPPPLSFPLIPHSVRYPQASSFDRDGKRGRRRRRRSLQDRPLPGDKDELNQDDVDDDDDKSADSPKPASLPVEDPELLDSDDHSSVETDALYQGYGTHYVDLWVGTPPQRQTVIVDTGSSVTAFPCMDCVNCGDTYHTDAYFQEDASSTFQDVSCQDCWLGQCMSSIACELSVSYQEGSSWRALEVMDLVHAGGPHTPSTNDAATAPIKNDHHTTFPFRFGCQTHLTGLFKTQLADGIMGMEMAESSFWKQLHKAHPGLVPQSFSLCFGHAAMATKEGSPAGLLHVGGTTPHLLHNTTMVYAHQPNHKGWFAVQIQAIYLRTGGGGLSVLVDDSTTTDDNDTDDKDKKVRYHKIDASVSQLNNGQVIVDSGTTDTYLSVKMSGPFERAWKQVTGRTFTNEAFTLSEEGLMALPTIVFQLKGNDDNDAMMQDPYAALVGREIDPKNPNDVLVAMPPSHYMEYSVEHDVFKIRIYLNELHGGVLGANFMLGHDILFDVENNRLGFAESDCDYDRVMNDLQQEQQSSSEGSL